MLQRADADVGFTAQRALFHVAAVDAQVAQDGSQLGQEGIGGVGAVDVGLGDDLQQGHAGAVQVYQREVTLMDRAPGVFFQMGAADADALLRPVGQVDVQIAVLAEGQLKLADLVTLGQVGIGVVLARKDGGVGDLAVERQPGLNGGFDRGAVDHGQHARHPQTDGAHARVGRRARIVGAAAAEHLGARQQLGMDFHADDQFVLCLDHGSRHRALGGG